MLDKRRNSCQNGKNINFNTLKGVPMIKQIYNKMSYFTSRYQRFLSKPEYKFFKEMIYSIIASRKPIVADQARCLTGKNNDTKHIEKRLRRNLKNKNLTDKIIEANLSLISKSKEKIKYIIVDDTDIQKKYAVKMEHISRVRDGDTGKIGQGYNVLDMIAVSHESSSIKCIYQELYNIAGEEMPVSSNTKILNALKKISKHINISKITMVFDRGFDRTTLIEPFLVNKYRFVIRLMKTRYLEIFGQLSNYREWIKNTSFKWEMIAIKTSRNGRIKNKRYEVGILKVKYIVKREKESLGKKVNMWLLVTRKKGAPKGKGYSYYLSNVEITDAYEAAKAIFESYGNRWKIEEYHRYIKENYRIEEIRLGKYVRLKMMILLMSISINIILGELGKRVCIYMSNKITKRRYIRWKKLKYFPLYIVTEYISKVISGLDLSKLRKEKNKSDNENKQICLFADVLLYGSV